MQIDNYTDNTEALRTLTDRLSLLVKEKGGRVFNLALSGGESAKAMFELWAGEYRDRLPWQQIRYFWVDERCVMPSSPESNYGHAESLFFNPLLIPGEHIHRIKGEEVPEAEARYYSDLVRALLPEREGLPYYDCIILGIGNDMHTASIFPNQQGLLMERKPYSISRHPQSGQWRVTMCGPFILNGTPILVPLLGKAKANVLGQLMQGFSPVHPLPASYILAHAEDPVVFASI